LTAAAARWRSVAPGDITWHVFEDGFVIFNQRTGSTHLLSAVGAAILEALLEAKHSLTLPDIQALLQIEISATDASVTQESLQSMLSEFEILGITEMEAI
jgi:PqqD family protein of HPr-rel-A system